MTVRETPGCAADFSQLVSHWSNRSKNIEDRRKIGKGDICIRKCKESDLSCLPIKAYLDIHSLNTTVYTLSALNTGWNETVSNNLASLNKMIQTEVSCEVNLWMDWVIYSAACREGSWLTDIQVRESASGPETPDAQMVYNSASGQASHDYFLIYVKVGENSAYSFLILYSHPVASPPWIWMVLSTRSPGWWHPAPWPRWSRPQDAGPGWGCPPVRWTAACPTTAPGPRQYFNCECT